jgi:hypothetical protein
VIVSRGEDTLGGKKTFSRIPEQSPRRQVIKSVLKEIADK